MDTDRDGRFELKLDAGRQLPEVIADRVKALIDEGFYLPGGRLDNESDLSRKMKVARSSVRTALQRLEARDVIEVRRGLGWFVRRPPPVAAGAGLFDAGGYELSEIFELRIGLEGLAVSLAAYRATSGDVDDMRKRNLDLQEAGEDQDKLVEADEAFHEALMRGSHNELLIDTYLPIVGRLRDWRYDSFGARGVAIRSFREHQKVLRYIGNHDSGGARAAVNSHLQRVYDELPEIAGEPLDLSDSWSDSQPTWPDHGR